MSCSAAPEAALERRPDLAAVDTWLLPNEVINGRALTLAGPSGLYIRTPKRCVIANYDPNDLPLESDLLELAALINGAERNGVRVDPLANIGGVLANLKRTYTMPSGEPPGRIISAQSFTCRAELGKHVEPRSVMNWPDRIHIYLNSTLAAPPIPDNWRKGLTTRIQILTDSGKPYCRIAFASKGSLIVKTRIDVQGMTRELPRYTDYRQMDCIMRGVIASTGFTGILRYDLQDIYEKRDLSSPGLAKGNYTNKLLNGFGTFQEAAWQHGDKI